MIPLFVGYAVLVWWPVCRFRRSVLGLLAVLVGTAAVVGFNLLHLDLADWLLNRRGVDIHAPVLQHLLWPYAGLIGAVGLFIVVLPKRYEGCCCNRCGYDLSAAPPGERTCPECGHETPALTNDDGSCGVCGFADLNPSVGKGVCPRCDTEFRRVWFDAEPSNVPTRREGDWLRPPNQRAGARRR